MRYFISGIILLLFGLFANMIYVAFAYVKIIAGGAPATMVPLTIGSLILVLGIYAPIAVILRLHYHRIAALAFFVAYISLTFPMQESHMKGTYLFAVLGILLLGIDYATSLFRKRRSRSTIPAQPAS